MSEKDSLMLTTPLPPDAPVTKLDLFLIFGELFSNKENIDKLISLNINEKGLIIIKNIVDNLPETFKSISEKINEIVKDEVLNIDDVPILVNLIKDVVNTDIKKLKQLMPNVEDVLLFLKTVLEILINKEFIKVENKEKVFKMIDISFLLLSTSIDIKEDFFTCLKTCFKS
jgi:hypothetical protein